MTADEIRARFLAFFQNHGHTVVESSSLVPHEDPTLLFTNAGMVQFKRTFVGDEKRAYSRAVSCQRCVRAGGKHNDLENVGHTARHHTFFEMLGNFSFGDYFKKEAIHFAWEFLTGELGMSPEHLWVSVYEDDDEAFALWQQVEGLPPGRIVRLGEKDNFWAMGDTGPCGPCSEIHIDQGPEAGCGRPDCAMGCDCDRYLELWNLVFMQFNRDQDGALTPLPKPSIDTGMGLERIAAVMQGKLSNYGSDLFVPLLSRLAEQAGRRYGDDQRADIAMRVIADHGRATALLVADGVLPSNEGRGYVLRRIMRRAVRFGRFLGLDKPFLAGVALQVVDRMKGAYPHLEESRDLLEQVAVHEEQRFRETLDSGMARLHDELEKLRVRGDRVLPGEAVFRLYDTYGFPVDIVRDVAGEDGFGVDEEGFSHCMEQQRLQSQKSWKDANVGQMAQGIRALIDAGHKATFVGYDRLMTTAQVVALIDEQGEQVPRVEKGDRFSFFCHETPFYAEAGGQVGDTGEIITAGGRARVDDTMAIADGIILHHGVVTEGAIEVDAPAELVVEDSRRRRIAANHTATHILHSALRQVLGGHVKQSGSLVTDERLRFDFTHFSQPTVEELQLIEEQANEVVRANMAVDTRLMSREEAMDSGATALFGEKYGDEVRVVVVDTVSRELCGGTHVGHTGAIGLIKIVSESSVAAGVRRLEAVTGAGALARFQQVEGTLKRSADSLHCTAAELPERITRLQEKVKDLEKRVDSAAAAGSFDPQALVAAAQTIDGVRLVAAQVPSLSAKALRDAGDRVRDLLGVGVTVLGSEVDGKVSLLAMVSKDLSGRLHAGTIISEIAKRAGGRGGGRPDMAQAGGGDPERLAEAIKAAGEIVAQQLASQ